MRKFALVLLVLTTSTFAQNEQKAACPQPPKKEAPACPTQEFAWGVGLVGLAVVGVVAGLTASMASGN
jgi:hypothetical protein